MVTVLGFLTLILMFTVIFQIAKIRESVVELRSEVGEADDNGDNRLNATLFITFLVAFLGVCFWSAFHYAPLYLPVPSSVHGQWIRNMFFWTLVATVPVFVVTHIALFVFAFQYRQRKGAKAYYYPHNNKLEVLWTVIPAIVLILLVYEGMRNWYKITATPENALIVETTGQQFNWTIRYAGADNQLGARSVMLIGSENPLGQDWADAANKDDFIADDLVLPVNKQVLVKITSLDVLHSFYLPHFRVKMDAVPGIPTQFPFIPNKTTQQMRDELNDPEFNYELACAELCGQAHYNMRKVVRIVEQEEYDAWLKEQTPEYSKHHGSGSDHAQLQVTPDGGDGAKESGSNAKVASSL